MNVSAQTRLQVTGVAPLSTKDAAPLSTRDAAPLSTRDAAPLSTRDAAMDEDNRRNEIQNYDKRMEMSVDRLGGVDIESENITRKYHQTLPEKMGGDKIHANLETVDHTEHKLCVVSNMDDDCVSSSVMEPKDERSTSVRAADTSVSENTAHLAVESTPARKRALRGIVRYQPESTGTGPTHVDKNTAQAEKSMDLTMETDIVRLRTDSESSRNSRSDSMAIKSGLDESPGSARKTGLSELKANIPLTGQLNRATIEAYEKDMLDMEMEEAIPRNPAQIIANPDATPYVRTIAVEKRTTPKIKLQRLLAPAPAPTLSVPEAPASQVGPKLSSPPPQKRRSLRGIVRTEDIPNPPAPVKTSLPPAFHPVARDSSHLTQTFDKPEYRNQRQLSGEIEQRHLSRDIEPAISYKAADESRPRSASREMKDIQLGSRSQDHSEMPYESEITSQRDSRAEDHRRRQSSESSSERGSYSRSSRKKKAKYEKSSSSSESSSSSSSSDDSSSSSDEATQRRRQMKRKKPRSRVSESSGHSGNSSRESSAGEVRMRRTTSMKSDESSHRRASRGQYYVSRREPSSHRDSSSDKSMSRTPESTRKSQKDPSHSPRRSISVNKTKSSPSPNKKYSLQSRGIQQDPSPQQDTSHSYHSRQAENVSPLEARRIQVGSNLRTARGIQRDPPTKDQERPSYHARGIYREVPPQRKDGTHSVDSLREQDDLITESNQSKDEGDVRRTREREDTSQREDEGRDGVGSGEVAGTEGGGSQAGSDREEGTAQLHNISYNNYKYNSGVHCPKKQEMV